MAMYKLSEDNYKKIEFIQGVIQAAAKEDVNDMKVLIGRDKYEVIEYFHIVEYSYCSS